LGSATVNLTGLASTMILSFNFVVISSTRLEHKARLPKI